MSCPEFFYVGYESYVCPVANWLSNSLSKCCLKCGFIFQSFIKRNLDVD